MAKKIVPTMMSVTWPRSMAKTASAVLMPFI
jgi:hypothetical protein